MPGAWDYGHGIELGRGLPQLGGRTVNLSEGLHDRRQYRGNIA